MHHKQVSRLLTLAANVQVALSYFAERSFHAVAESSGSDPKQ